MFIKMWSKNEFNELIKDYKKVYKKIEFYKKNFDKFDIEKYCEIQLHIENYIQIDCDKLEAKLDELYKKL
jgi:isoleucyl-tRNA synthetase